MEKIIVLIAVSLLAILIALLLTFTRIGRFLLSAIMYWILILVSFMALPFAASITNRK